jgi:hypothetical protein
MSPVPAFSASLYGHESKPSTSPLDSLRQPLLLDTATVYLSDDGTDGSSDHSLHTAAAAQPVLSSLSVAVNLVFGCVLGVSFSVSGFYLLVTHWPIMTSWSVLSYSLVWSSATSAAAYILFGLAWSICGIEKRSGRLVNANDDDSDSDDEEDDTEENDIYIDRMAHQAEYYFAMGVFIGFCGASTVTDIMFGMSWFNIAVTVVIALVWASIMMHCAARELDALALPKSKTATLVLPESVV